MVLLIMHIYFPYSISSNIFNINIYFFPNHKNENAHYWSHPQGRGASVCPTGHVVLIWTQPQPGQWPGLQLNTSASGKRTRPSTLTSDLRPVQPWVDSHRRVSEGSVGRFCWGSALWRATASSKTNDTGFITFFID